MMLFRRLSLALLRCIFFFLNDPPTPEISPLPLPAALPISWGAPEGAFRSGSRPPRPFPTQRTIRVSWLSPLLRVLRQPLDVLEHPQVDGPHDPVGVELPVGLRSHFHFVPGASLQPRAPAGEREQPELAPRRSEVPVQVRGVHVAVGAPLAPRRRLGRDGEPQHPGLLPGG